MAKLTDLPVELLHMIADSGDSTSDESYGFTILNEPDIASLALTSRRLHAVFNQILYQKNMKYHEYKLFSIAVHSGNLDTFKVAESFQIIPPRIGPPSIRPLLNLACENGYSDIAEWLLDHGAPYLEVWPCEEYEDDYLWGCPALWMAMRKSKEETTLLMLSRGAHPFYKTERDTIRSALHYAARFNMGRVVDYLVKDKGEYLVRDKGFFIDIPDFEWLTPLHYMIRHPETLDTDTAMIEKLIELGANVNFESGGDFPLTSALMRGKYMYADILLDAGSKIKPNRPVRKVQYPIHALIYSTKSMTSPLDRLVQEAMLMRLYAAGASLTEKYYQGYSPIQEAIVNGSYEITSYLLAILGKKYEKTIDATRLLGLMMRNLDHVKSFNDKLVELLKYGARMDVPVYNGKTLVQWVATDQRAESNGCSLYDLLDAAACNRKHLNDFLTEYATARKYDWIRNSERIISVLISFNAIIEDPDNIYSAAKASMRRFQGHTLPKSYISMLDSGIPAKKLPKLLTDALMYRSSYWVKHLVGRMEHDFDPLDINPEPEWIYEAARWGNIDILRRLLESIPRIDLNHITKDGKTPLATLIRTGHTLGLRERAILFLEYGADPFLLKNHPICREDYVDFQSHIWGASAFEIAIHSDYHDIAQEIWERTAPKARPDPRIFMQCINKDRYESWVGWFDKISVEEYYSDWVALLKQIEGEDDNANQNEETN